MLSICSNSCIRLQRIEKISERISKIKPSVDNCNWKGINYLSRKDDWEKFEKNNPIITIITLNVLHVFKKRIHTMLTFQNETQSMEDKLLF